MPFNATCVPGPKAITAVQILGYLRGAVDDPTDQLDPTNESDYYKRPVAASPEPDATY